jgi:hypothetical protein
MSKQHYESERAHMLDMYNCVVEQAIEMKHNLAVLSHFIKTTYTFAGVDVSFNQNVVIATYDCSGTQLCCVSSDASGIFMPCSLNDNSGNILPCVLPPSQHMYIKGQHPNMQSGTKDFPFYPYYSFFDSDDEYCDRNMSQSRDISNVKPVEKCWPPYYNPYSGYPYSGYPYYRDMNITVKPPPKINPNHVYPPQSPYYGP